jgi:cysteine desulfurase
MSERAIYLDYNATTPVLPEVLEAMLPYLRDHFGNPSSAHARGRAGREAVEASRAKVAALLGCEADEIVFTSGGTESNNLAILGAAEACPERRHVVISVFEHPAVAGPCGRLEERGWRITRIGTDGDGQVRVADTVASIDRGTVLVTVMHANNETGVLQPVTAIAEVAHAAGALVHTDAAQSVGKVPVDARALGVDLLTVVGHKLYAPQGVGALYVKRGTLLRPLMVGGGHERGIRPGTENVAAIVGMGAACEHARLDLETEATRVRSLRDRLWRGLAAAIPGLAINGHPEQRLPNTLSVRFPGVSGPAVLGAAPRVDASTGSACHAGEVQAPAAIVAMGVAAREALGTVRLTLGRGSTREEVDEACAALVHAWRSLSHGPPGTR